MKHSGEKCLDSFLLNPIFHFVFSLLQDAIPTFFGQAVYLLFLFISIPSKQISVIPVKVGKTEDSRSLFCGLFRFPSERGHQNPSLKCSHEFVSAAPFLVRTPEQLSPGLTLSEQSNTDHQVTVMTGISKSILIRQRLAHPIKRMRPRYET